ncbi:MAG: NAD(P)-dependent oxidoreductase [Patescibacteria group bacterium]|nr:NAD(P)-dependent oxidoreductase [Patescibacteria group bacterium]
MAKITLFKLNAVEKAFFKKHLKGHELTFVNNPLTSRNASRYKQTEIAVVFVFSQISKEVIDKLPNLKSIATMSTGYDHIDADYARQKNIFVSNVPFYGQNTVAEHAFGLLIALNRNLIEAVRRTREGKFSYEGLQGRDISGKTLGVFGTGRIGQYMIKFAKAFNMKVIAFDVFKNIKLAKDLGFTYASKNQVLKKSDFISLHLPLLPSTKHYISKDEFKLMKKESMLINTSRGGLIDTDALIQALNKKQIAGVALDVLELETDFKREAQIISSDGCSKERLKVLVENEDLIHRDNVIITPHLAFYTEEATQRILKTTYQNINAFLKGKCKNKVK